MRTNTAFILIMGLMYSGQSAWSACIERNGVFRNILGQPCTPNAEETELTNNVHNNTNMNSNTENNPDNTANNTVAQNNNTTTDETNNTNNGKQDKKQRGGNGPNYRMDEQNKTNSYGGSYGGRSTETTRIINQSLDMGNQMADKIGTAAMSGVGNSQTANVASKGINATTQDYNKAQKTVLEENAKQNAIVGSINSAAAVTQGLFSVLHMNSAKKIKQDQEALIGKIDGELDTNEQQTSTIKDKEIPKKEQEIAQCEKIVACKKTATTPEAIAACDVPVCCDESDLGQKKEELAALNKQVEKLEKEHDKLNQRREYAEANGAQEIKAQKDQALINGVAAANTAAQASLHYMNAAASKNLADSMDTSGSGSGSNATFNFTAPQGTLNEGNGVATAAESEAVVATDPNAGGPGLDGGIKDFNPNIGANGAAGPAPMAFKDDAGKGAAGGGGAGLGGAGGTSAARDGGEGKQEGGPSKSQTGGMYASGDGASPRYSRGSGGSGVGFDSNFGDLLKRMLPGGKDDKKEQASLDMNDRGPASDQAAVIGRNKNIFIEISKRYQKKNSEGAVIFQ